MIWNLEKNSKECYRVWQNNNPIHHYREIKRLYRVDQNPEVQNGKKTEAEAFADYISSFEPDFLNRQENEKDSRVRINETYSSIKHTEFILIVVFKTWKWKIIFLTILSWTLLVTFPVSKPSIIFLV